MKKLEIWSKAAHMAAALLVTGIGLVPMTSCDQFDDSELKQQITDINDRLTALETEMDTQLAALQAIVDGKTTILSCLLDEETGMYTITLSDKENTVIEIPAVGNEIVPVLTYIEEDGVKYWATVSEGGAKTAITGAGGEKIPVEAETPVLQLGENGEWMVSAGGTWTSLGVTSENVAIFAKAEETETSVIFTLADGTELEVNKFDATEADIYPLVGKQFFDAGEERIIEFVLEGISNIAVMEVPAGWHASTTRSSLTVTAPAADDADADIAGVVKILGVTADGKSFISEVYVEVGEPALEITVSPDQTADITVMANLGYDNSVFYGVMPISEYSPEAVVDGLNDGSLMYEMTQTSVTDKPLSEILGADLEENTVYIVWAVVSSWSGYTADDVYSASYQPIKVTFEFTSIKFDDVQMSVNVSGTNDFVPGFIIKDEGAQTFDDILAAVALEGSWPFRNYGPTYNGSLLYYGSYGDTPLVPGSDYIVYALPLIDGKDIAAYTADDFFYKEISVPDITAGGSVTPQITELATSMSSVSAQIVADGAYKVYAQWIPKAEYEAFADEAAIVAQVTASVALFEPYSFSINSLEAGEEGYLVAVAVDNDAKYAVASQEANLKTLTWSETTSIALGDVEIGMSSVKIPYTVTGGSVTGLKYVNMTAEEFPQVGGAIGWERDLTVMEKYLAAVEPDQYGSVQYGVTIIPDQYGMNPLPEDNVINIDYLSAGREYVFYLVALDENGLPTKGVECTYTPGIEPSLIMRDTDADYQKGKPTVTLKSASCYNDMYPYESFYDITVDITMPAECSEYYLCPLDASMTSDWVNALYYVLSNAQYSGIYATSSSSDVIIPFIVYGGYIGLVWKDTDGMYHQTELTTCDYQFLGIPAPGSTGGSGESGDEGIAGDNER